MVETAPHIQILVYTQHQSVIVVTLLYIRMRILTSLVILPLILATVSLGNAFAF